MSKESTLRPLEAGGARNTVATLRVGERAVHLEWGDGHASVFHYVWLRDNCDCSRCRHPQTLERIFDPFDVPEEPRPEPVTLDADGALRIRWPDHSEASRYAPAWLRAHCYSDAARAERARRPHTWDAGLAQAIPSFEYYEVLAHDDALHAWLAALRDTGVALVRGGPHRGGAVLEAARRIARLRETNFGLVFDVISKPEPNNNAYTALALPLHTDLPNWEFPPGYQFLYCIANEAQGGDTVLLDGFRAAEVLARRDPEAFAILTHTAISFRFLDDEVDISHRAPVIGLDADGGLREIRYNASLIGPLDAPASRVKGLFRALRAFMAVVHDHALQVRLRLAPGELLVFHNRRVLHGRTAFDPTAGRRHLQGCYVDVDDLLSRIRVLERAACQPAF
ncbi:MAG: DUF971 domain-containing protein [Gammaproteobacteria bacterium]|nr:DUF971 domain-containing protein [Gammaproteobacteria bacterium]NIR58731.1 DUF971 domain-containing protein [Gammaproteobacteria bacterium]NIR88585.1 DUF971 domain-containing protein [Gammaproteobacteria bacterium]